MRRPLKPEEARLWGVVAATVHPLRGRETPAAPAPPAQAAEPIATRQPTPAWAARAPAPRPVARPVEASGKPIEPRRRGRIARERETIGARLDLHGLDQDRARAVLERFLRRAWDEGYRAVLVITGKGVTGDGVLRRRTPEWLAAPYLGEIVAGVSEAHRRHGGEGALYVALKRRPRT
jgi:DNA-nicking Smr family endonuclease